MGALALAELEVALVFPEFLVRLHLLQSGEDGVGGEVGHLPA